MDRELIALTMVPVMLSGFSSGISFFAALGTTSLVCVVTAFGLKVLLTADMKAFGFTKESSFIGVPMLILIGTLLTSTGIPGTLFYTVYKFFGPIRCGLLFAIGFVCSLMAACTGVE